MNIIIRLLFVLICLWAYAARANINYIDVNKISQSENLRVYFSFIKENQEYYDHWVNEWSYDKDKELLIIKLKEAYSAFAAVEKKNAELYLLQAETAHYLYNMDATNYYDSAIKAYMLALKSAPDDYRASWFLAYHYSLSNVPEKAVEYFLKAQNMAPGNKPVAFWEEYTFATLVTQMPSHAIFGMNRIKGILGKPGNFETELGATIYSRMVNLDRDSSYKKEDIWSASVGEKITFLSRPLSIKILLDSTWDLSVYGYDNRQSQFIITPPVITSKKGKRIGYTVGIFMKVANDTEKLATYMDKLSGKYVTRKPVVFSKKYDSMLAYEIQDPALYPNVGGGHLYVVGIEREMPENPGMLLEDPVILSGGEKGEVNYYRSTDFKNRFKGRIFYMLMLDTCGDIFDESFSNFKTLFNDQVIIE